MIKIRLLIVVLVCYNINLNAQITWDINSMDVSNNSFGNMHPRMSKDRLGNPLVVWGRTSDKSVMFSRWNGTSFTTPIKINPSGMDVAPVQVDMIADSISRFPTITTDPLGNPLVAFMKFNSSFSESRWVVTKSQDFGNTFSQNVFARGLFMGKGQFEVKNFNNLYTETFKNNKVRNSFFTSFLQITIGSKRNINYGFDFLYKSNVTNDFNTSSPLNVFNLKRQKIPNFNKTDSLFTDYNHGLSHAGGRIRIKPFKDLRFTLQQAVYIPLGKIDGGVISNTDLFFEYLTTNNKVMIFADLGLWYNTKQLPFPYLKLFAGTLIQKRLGPYIMLNLPYELGGGLKIFIHPKVELELLYTWWLPIEWIIQDKKPHTFNLGLRFTNFKSFNPK